MNGYPASSYTRCFCDKQGTRSIFWIGSARLRIRRANLSRSYEYLGNISISWICSRSDLEPLKSLKMLPFLSVIGKKHSSFLHFFRLFLLFARNRQDVKNKLFADI